MTENMEPEGLATARGCRRRTPELKTPMGPFHATVLAPFVYEELLGLGTDVKTHLIVGNGADLTTVVGASAENSGRQQRRRVTRSTPRLGGGLSNVALDGVDDRPEQGLTK